MQRWQHATVVFHYENNSDHRYVSIRAAGKITKKFTGYQATIENTSKLLDELGAEGWEAVGMTRVSNLDWAETTYLMKRPANG